MNFVAGMAPERIMARCALARASLVALASLATLVIVGR